MTEKELIPINGHEIVWWYPKNIHEKFRGNIYRKSSSEVVIKTDKFFNPEKYQYDYVMVHANINHIGDCTIINMRDSTIKSTQRGATFEYQFAIAVLGEHIVNIDKAIIRSARFRSLFIPHFIKLKKDPVKQGKHAVSVKGSLGKALRKSKGKEIEFEVYHHFQENKQLFNAQKQLDITLRFPRKISLMKFIEWKLSVTSFIEVCTLRKFIFHSYECWSHNVLKQNLINNVFINQNHLINILDPNDEFNQYSLPEVPKIIDHFFRPFISLPQGLMHNMHGVHKHPLAYAIQNYITQVDNKVSRDTRLFYLLRAIERYNGQLYPVPKAVLNKHTAKVKKVVNTIQKNPTSIPQDVSDFISRNLRSMPLTSFAGGVSSLLKRIGLSNKKFNKLCINYPSSAGNSNITWRNVSGKLQEMRNYIAHGNTLNVQDVKVGEHVAIYLMQLIVLRENNIVDKNWLETCIKQVRIDYKNPWL